MATQNDRSSGFTRFVAEMKRRHVVRFAVGYAAAAFVILQLAEIVFPAFGMGDRGLRILVAVVALLFPPSVVLAWIFDITAEGIRRTKDEDASGRRLPQGTLIPRVSLLVLTVAIVGSVALWLAREGVLSEEAATPPRQDAPTLVAYDASVPIRSLAVLPLDDFSDDGGQDYFTAGLQEELIAQLSQIAGLRVVSRTSVQRYHDSETPIPVIGRDLQVDAVIEGSVRRSGDQVRITVQLIHAASDTHIWTQQYDRSLTDVLGLQSEVALDIAGQIQAEVAPEEATTLRQVASRDVDPVAQEAYLRGKYELSKGTSEANRAALDYFEEAVTVDSSFAPALASLAGTRFLVGMGDSTEGPRTLEQAQREVRRALAMDSTSVEAHEVMAFLGHVGAVPTAPGQPVTDTTWVVSVTQLGQRIADEMRDRRKVMSESGPQLVGSARQLAAAGRFDEASRLLAGVVDDAPAVDPAWELMARMRMSAGDPQGAVGVVEEWSARGGPDAPDAGQVAQLRQAVTREGAAGYWRWYLERLEGERAKGGRVSATERAAALTGLGRDAEALTALEEALQQRERGLAALERDPVWDGLRDDPGFADIVRKSRAVRFTPEAPRGPGGIPRR